MSEPDDWTQLYSEVCAAAKAFPGVPPSPIKALIERIRAIEAMTEPIRVPDDFPQYCGRTDSMGVECEKPELEKRLAKAEAERDALKARTEEIMRAALETEKAKGERIEELENDLKRIADWCDAYPFGFVGGIFDEPDMEQVRALLGDDLLTQLSAHNFRHVLNGVKAIAARKE
jgi:hypothetical protein